MGWNRFTCTFSEILLLGLLLSSAKQASAAVSLKILTYPSEVKIDAPFTLTASISGLEANHAFPLKVGVSTGSTYYGYGQVKNGDRWIGYNDTDSCSNAPSFRADETGHWEGDVEAKVGSTAKAGNGKLRFKICDPDKSSESYAIKLLEMDKPPEPEPEKSEETQQTETQTNVETHYNASLPDESDTSTEDPQPTLINEPPPPPKSKPISKIEYKLPATLSAVPAVLGQKIASTSSPEASSTASSSASESAKTKTSKSFIIIVGAILTTLFTGLYLGYRHFHRQ